MAAHLGAQVTGHQAIAFVSRARNALKGAVVVEGRNALRRRDDFGHAGIG